uniref:Uncharacterized protein n=1 Tax=Timema douglasi TaxID=61478 RepID=A0A7R8Z7P2_TIMDO|nr:unnamed protein product [Timema douglasi]
MRVLLFPEEGWARSASSSYWTLTPSWWSSSRCQVVEVAGTRSYKIQTAPGNVDSFVDSQLVLNVRDDCGATPEPTPAMWAARCSLVARGYRVSTPPMATFLSLFLSSLSPPAFFPQRSVGDVVETKFVLLNSPIKPPLHQSAAKIYRPSDRRLLAKIEQASADRGYHVVDTTNPPAINLSFPDQICYISIQVAPR